MAASLLPAVAWLLLLPVLLGPVASATGSLQGSAVSDPSVQSCSVSDSASAQCIDGALPVPVDGRLLGDEEDTLLLRQLRANRRSENVMLVIGSNNLGQTADRIGVDESTLTSQRAVLENYQREFRGLAKGRSFGAVATPIRKEGRQLKGMLLWFPERSTKAVTDHKGAVWPPGSDTFALMDAWESAGPHGYQYFRTTRKVNYYDDSVSSSPKEIDAQVYILKRARRIIVGKKSGAYKKSVASGHWPWVEYNNGMVSKGYVDAVLQMLLESWGRDRINAAEDFPPARNTRICSGVGNTSCRLAYTVVMFDEHFCNGEGDVDEYGQRRGACVGSESTQEYVPKYSVNDYVPDKGLSDMSPAIMGPPGPL